MIILLNCFDIINSLLYPQFQIDNSNIFQNRETVFHYVADEGNVDVVKQILKGLHSGQIQLAVNKQSSTGWSPLIIASHKGHLDIVKVSFIFGFFCY